VRFIGDHECIKLVVPGSKVSMFTVFHESQTHQAKVPSNVLSMGMPEGQAIGELINGLHQASPKTKVIIVPAPHFEDDGTPFICIGGPSINSIARRYVSRFFPDFSIKYPEHVAGWSGEASYKPRLNREEELIEDFGFLFIGTESYTRFILLFGVWPFGTLVAARSFLSARRGSEIYNTIFRLGSMAMISHADVADYFVGYHKIIETKRSAS
jgi:hypothetical protein